MDVVLIGLVFVVVGTLAYLALRNAQDFSDANEIVPGVPTNAPKQWAGAHSPEARLHRRIRDAVASLLANNALDAPDLAPVRTMLQDEALAIDDKLIAVATVSSKHNDEPMRQIDAAVDALESAIAELVLLRGPSATATAEAIEGAHVRARLVEEARRELEGLGASPDLEALRRSLEAAPPADRPGDEDPGSAGDERPEPSGG